jgi:predicted transcriptional regulator
MRKHNGMRPQDVAILLKIISMNGQHWQLSVLANSLRISISEISESLNRSQFASLIDYHKKKINRQNLMEFLEHGVRYVFPQQPGSMVRGILTAHSHPFMKKSFISEMNYVWPDNKGDVMGLMIEPFYPKQVEAVKEDPEYYKLMALIDVIRVGKVREVKYAVNELKKNILHEPSN